MFDIDFKCGVANSPASRIVGGIVSEANEYPWTVFLNLYFWSGDRATCTGTLIGSKWILTAAHCSFGYNLNPNFVQPNLILMNFLFKGCQHYRRFGLS